MNRLVSIAVMIFAVGLFFILQSDLYQSPDIAAANVLRSKESAPSAVSAKTPKENTTSTGLFDDTIARLRIGSEEFGIVLPPEMPDILRAYILEDFSRILTRVVTAEVKSIEDKVVRSGDRKITVQGRLTIKSLLRDFQVKAIGDRLRDVTNSGGRWDIIVPDSLIQRYRDAQDFWNEHPEQLEGLRSFVTTFKALSAKGELTREELSVLTSDTSPLLEYAKSNPLATIRILDPSPLAYEVEDRGDGYTPEVRTGVPFIRESEMGLLILKFDGSRWIMVPL